MNRDRFKFRVWDKIDDQYYPASVFCASDLADPDDSTVVEQCTGLKDRNGKLIYEGDIVSFQSRGLFFKGIVVWTQEEVPGEITLGGFGIRLPEGVQVRMRSSKSGERHYQVSHYSYAQWTTRPAAAALRIWLRIQKGKE